MGKICRHTGGVDDIVQREFINQRAGLQEERQWLPTSCQPLQESKGDSLGNNVPGRCHQMHQGQLERESEIGYRLGGCQN